MPAEELSCASNIANATDAEVLSAVLSRKMQTLEEPVTSLYGASLNHHCCREMAEAHGAL